MSIEIKVPTLGESINEATVSKWLKKEGETFEIDEPLVEIETDKITLEVAAPSSGTLEKIKVEEGNDIKVGGVLGLINESKKSQNNEKKEIKNIKEDLQPNEIISPSAKKMIAENDLDVSKIATTREDKRINKSDVIEYISDEKNSVLKNEIKESKKNQEEEIVKMSNIRKTIAKRLKDAQNNSAILTTFNEVDMSEIIKIRDAKKDSFVEQYGVKLGYMSFFVKATISALQEFPAINAEIREDNIVYKNYFHIGIAVGTENGLVVPVIKNANELNFGQTEKIIFDLSTKAKEGKLTIDDLSNGTFTISNGGVYGSMLSTPILNTPQSGILGIHNIVKRPTVVEDSIVIRPIMYLAFSYDHRLIDGKEAVGFLVSIKKTLENPSKMILGF